MGFLTRQPDPEGMGAELGCRPIRSFIDLNNRSIAGGQRPARVDTSREGNRADNGPAGWGRAKPADETAGEQQQSQQPQHQQSQQPQQQQPKTLEQIQSSYDDLYQ